jgi:5-methylcytosine-specific restriction endonuclease McrA
MVAWYTGIAVALALFATNADATTPRGRSARAVFMHEHPCPTNGRHRGACPGWQVDHVIPLKCNGPDTPTNMQWLTVEEHKAKTRSEARWCRSPH